MCIIAAKPQGINMPAMRYVYNCFNANKDGAGLAYVRPGDKQVTILKGYMTYKEFKKALKVLKFTDKDSVLMHFRMSTHGLTDQGNCHPFPLTADLKAMRELHTNCNVAIAHNGIFSSVPDHHKYSDTMKFISGILAQPEIINQLERPAIQSLISGYCGSSSKLAFLKPSGITLVGHWVKQDGVSYSNSGYAGYTYGFAHGTNWWDDEKEWQSSKIIKPNKRLIISDKHNIGLKDRCEWCYAPGTAQYEEGIEMSLCDACDRKLNRTN